MVFQEKHMILRELSMVQIQYPRETHESRRFLVFDILYPWASPWFVEEKSPPRLRYKTFSLKCEVWLRMAEILAKFAYTRAFLNFSPYIHLKTTSGNSSVTRALDVDFMSFWHFNLTKQRLSSWVTILFSSHTWMKEFPKQCKDANWII